jgi:hypothetical protein
VADELRIGLSELLRKAMIEQDAGFLKEGVRVLSQVLMEMEVEEHVGAGRHERSPARTGQRNGYRQRDWDTRVGTAIAADSERSLPFHGRPAMAAKHRQSKDAPKKLAQVHRSLNVTVAFLSHRRALARPLIHRSAWKVNSRKSISTNLHNTTLVRAENDLFPAL